MPNFTVSSNTDTFMQAANFAAMRTLLGLNLFNVKDYGAVGDGATDDTAAVNAAIAACFAAGGGIVYFPNGHYIFIGSFNATTNSILTVPQEVGYGWWHGLVQIQFIGESCGYLNLDGDEYEGGVVLDFSGHPVASGTYPAAIGFAPYVVTPVGDLPTLLGTFQRVGFAIDNIMLLVEPNPTIAGIQAANLEQLRVGDTTYFSAKTIAGNGGSGQPANGYNRVAQQPTNAAAIAIYAPQTQNNVIQNIGSAFIFGWYEGVRGGEHLRFNRPWIGFCNTAWVVNQCAHMASGQICMEHNRRMLAVDGAATQAILNISIEAEIVQRGDWYDLQSGGGVVDSGNILRGEIRYQIADYTGGVEYPNIEVTGAGNLDRFNLYNSTGRTTYGGGGAVEPEAGTPLILDNFSGDGDISGRTPAPTNTPGNNWVEVSGTWATTGGVLQQTANTAANLFSVVDGEAANLTVGVDVTVDGGGISAGVAFRWIDSDDFWIAFLSTGGSVLVYKSVAGDLGSPLLNVGGVTFGATPRIVVTDDGTDVAVYVNEVQVGVVEGDTTHAAGTSYGVFNYGAAEPAAQIYDNFQVTQPV